MISLSVSESVSGFWLLFIEILKQFTNNFLKGVRISISTELVKTVHSEFIGLKSKLRTKFYYNPFGGS